MADVPQSEQDFIAAEMKRNIAEGMLHQRRVTTYRELARKARRWNEGKAEADRVSDAAFDAIADQIETMMRQSIAA